MREHFIKFIDEDITVLARVYGNDITVENATVLSSFLRDHKKELFGGENK